MVYLALTLACCYLNAATVLTSQGPSSSEPEPAQRAVVDPLVVHSSSVDSALLIEALALRLPGRRFTPSGTPAQGPATRTGHIVLSRPGTTTEVALILWDGRAFYRTLEAAPEDLPREVATSLANLLAGIEAGRLEPDATDVVVPKQAEPKQAAPTPEKQQAEPKKPVAKLDPEPVAAPKPGPAIDFGWALAPSLLLAVGPPSARVIAAVGGEVLFDTRFASGGLISVGLRAAQRRHLGYTLTRLRISVGGGYVWRRGAFELTAAATLDAEPWFVRKAGAYKPLAQEPTLPPDVQSQGQPATPPDNDASLATAVGGHLRLVPAYRYTAKRGRLSVRVGPRIDIGAGSNLRPAAGVARVRVSKRNEDGTSSIADIFRVGGLELGIGIEFGMWFGRTRGS